MTNIVKHFYYLFFFSFIANVGFSQVLKPTNLNLNLGGVIYDVADSKVTNCYVIVGDFSSVDGNTVNNIAFINKSDFSLNTSFTSSVFAIDEAIYSIEIHHTFTSLLPITQTDHIYIAGKFTTVNSSNHSKIALLQTSSIGGAAANVPALNSWDAEVDYGGAGAFVNDLLITGDTLIFAGGLFSDVMNDIRTEIGAIKIPNNTLITGYLDNWTGSYSPGGFNSIEILNGSLFASYSDEKLQKIDPVNNVWDNSTTYSPDGVISNGPYFYDFTLIQDSIIAMNYGWKFTYFNASTVTEYMNIFTGDAYEPNSHLFGNPSTKDYNFVNSRRWIKPYKNKIFISNADNLLKYNIDSIDFVPYGTSPTKHIPPESTQTANANNPEIIHKQLFIEDNVLFYTNSAMSSIEGQTRQGLAIYCLEPMDITNYTYADTTFCPGQDSLLFTVNIPNFATDYKWEYSGIGAIVRTNSGSTYDTINPGDFHISDTNSIYIKLDNNATAGILTVSALSECGEASKPFIITMTMNPLPQINAGLDTTLTCSRDSAILIGSSTTTNTTYQWHEPGNVFPIFNDSLIVFNDTSYLFQVTDSLGCSNFDTVFVVMDTVAPVANLISGPTELTCLVTSLNFNGSSNNVLDSLSWKDNSNITVNNPITANSQGFYSFIVIDRINGCEDVSQVIEVTSNLTPPNLGVNGYPLYSPVDYLDTITCSNDTLNLISESTNPDAITHWTSMDSTQNFGNNYQITQSGIYYITATDTLNGCSIYKPVLINDDTIKPILNIPPGPYDFNCSFDSVTISANSPSLDTEIEWTGASIIPTADSVIVYNQGNYYVVVTDSLNGCTTYDSVTVGYFPDISFNIGIDTIVCNQSLVTITAPAVNPNITNINYTWSNGGSATSSNFSGGTDTIVILEMFGDNSCYGTDTLFITIPDIPTGSVSSFKPCGNGNDGQIVMNLTGGLSPFNYSIDGGIVFQTSPIFTNLGNGTYNLIARDSLGCDYDYQTSISDTSSPPTPLFLVSTNNFISDTVVLVDVSTPPADSVEWTFPVGIQVLDSNELAPIIILPDTGAYVIAMTGYYGPCNVDVFKTIYSAEYDSTFATQNNLNGIESIILYPNPNNGVFTVEVEFYKKQNAVCTIQDISGNPVFYNSYDDTESIIENISIPNAQTGTYIFKVVSEFDSSYFTFIITQ